MEVKVWGLGIGVYFLVYGIYHIKGFWGGCESQGEGITTTFVLGGSLDTVSLLINRGYGAYNDNWVVGDSR